ncbi:hypothetical protein D3C84_1202520 [compost metagenome]
MVEQGRGDGPVTQVQVFPSGVHAQDMTDVFIVGCVIGEVAVHHQKAKKAYIGH